MNSEDYQLYILAEMRYINKNNEICERDLFPIGWYNIKNYRVKIKIIAEALKENKLIKETDLYKEIMKKC